MFHEFGIKIHEKNWNSSVVFCPKMFNYDSYGRDRALAHKFDHIKQCLAKKGKPGKSEKKKEKAKEKVECEMCKLPIAKKIKENKAHVAHHMHRKHKQ